MRSSSFEVVTVKDADFARAKDRWHELREYVRCIRNILSATWFFHHVLSGSVEQIIEWMAKDREWAKYKNEMQKWNALPKRKRGEKPKKPRGKDRPKCPVEMLDKQFAKELTVILQKRFPDANTRLLSIIQQSWRSNLASKGRFSRYSMWIELLKGLSSRQSHEHDQPIPFDVKMSKIHPPDDGDKLFSISLKFDRLAPEPGQFRGTCPPQRLMIRCGGKKVRSQIRILERIVSGEYQFKGSNLNFHSGKRKWLLNIAYEMPKPEPLGLDPDQIAVLLPSKDRPFHLKFTGERFRFWPGHDGLHIAEKRSRLFLTRRSRSRAYRRASRNSKGHGRDRALKWREKYQSLWNDFVNTCNGQMASAIVKRCIERGVGTLVYFEPEVGYRDHWFLSRAGKDDRWNEATTWDWTKFLSSLRRASENKVTVLVEPFGPKVNRSQSVAEDQVEAAVN